MYQKKKTQNLVLDTLLNFLFTRENKKTKGNHLKLPAPKYATNNNALTLQYFQIEWDINEILV